MILEVILGCSVIAYVAFLLYCLIAWKKGCGDYRETSNVFSGISVLLPVRNEEESIEKTLHCFTSLHVPSDKTELIVIDDHSDDDTVQRVEQFIAANPFAPIKIVRATTSSGKKAALEAGVAAARLDIIVTTDGDVEFNKEWLQRLVSSLSPGRLVCGPVLLKSPGKNQWLNKLVLLESMGLTMITAAGIVSRNPFFCNGANMAFYKKDFVALGGYSSDKKQLTGDDTTLLLKFPRSNVSFAFHADALVTAAPAGSVTEFMRQRQRWASKVPTTLTRSTLVAAIIAWLAHASLLAAFVGCFFLSISLPLLVIAILIKVLIEYFVLKAVGNLFREQVSFGVLLVAQPFYWSAIVIIGLLAVLVPYRWKGRSSIL